MSAFAKRDLKSIKSTSLQSQRYSDEVNFVLSKKKSLGG